MSRCKEWKIGCLLCKIGTKRKRCSAANKMLACYHIFMNKYLTSLSLLTRLGVNNISATSVLSKNRLCKCTIVTDKKQQEMEYGRFEQCAASKKIQSTFHSGWFEREQRGARIASPKFSEPKRFVCSLNTVEGKNIQEQQPN